MQQTAKEGQKVDWLNEYKKDTENDLKESMTT